MPRNIMKTDPHEISTLVVVDARPSEYQALLPLAQVGEIELHFLLSARSALRQAACLGAPVWLINVHLPDRSGLDLFEMLWGCLASAQVFMVDDEYSDADERRALSLGAAKYFCKPLDFSWIAELPRFQKPAGSPRFLASPHSPLPRRKQ